MQVTAREAVRHVQERFPFPGYMEASPEVYLNIAETALRHVKPPAKILDFASGPCDKTAVLQSLGFECAAIDDLQDHWHGFGDNRKKILAFARESGVDLYLATEGSLPFEKSSFDMMMMHDILEHLHDSPRELINDLIELVRPGGYFFATVPNAVNIRKRLAVLLGRTNYPAFDSYYWFPGQWRGHVREYVRKDLVHLCTYLNLQVCELRSCHHMLRKVPKVLLPLYLGLTCLFTGWRDSWLLVAKKPKDWVTQREIPEDRLEAVLGRTTRYQY